MNDGNVDGICDKREIIKGFFEYGEGKEKEEGGELIGKEKLKEREGKDYMEICLKGEQGSEKGSDFKKMLGKMSGLNGEYVRKKERVLEKIVGFMDKFKGVGGDV